MRSRFLVPFGMLGIGVPAILFLVPRAFYAHTSPDYIGSFDTWSPTPAQIAREVGPIKIGVSEAAQRERFRSLFQERYRSHEQAVGVHFTGPHSMKLMFAALIPRWDMAHVAIAAYREARQDLHQSLDIDIYETYISIPQRKVAELRANHSAGSGQGELNINFDPRFAKESESKRTIRRSSPIPRFMLPYFYMDPGTWRMLSGIPVMHPYPIAGQPKRPL